MFHWLRSLLTRKKAPATMPEKIEKTEAQWREQLTPVEYNVTRAGGTEPAFTGAYWQTKSKGVYNCHCCGLPLYHWKAKFDSGTGWPSFYEPVNEYAVETRTDTGHGMTRTEALCARCGAHLGHVFPDGPKPTGERHCINSMSLRLDEKAR